MELFCEHKVNCVSAWKLCKVSHRMLNVPIENIPAAWCYQFWSTATSLDPPRIYHVQSISQGSGMEPFLHRIQFERQFPIVSAILHLLCVSLVKLSASCPKCCACGVCPDFVIFRGDAPKSIARRPSIAFDFSC